MIIAIHNQEEWETNEHICFFSDKMSPKRFPCFIRIIDSSGMGFTDSSTSFEIAYPPIGIEKLSSVEAFEKGIFVKWSYLYEV